ncbi:MAG: YggS family pyridoxal phosphate-dependent enzyme [Beijerinckiaceae bacterium]
MTENAVTRLEATQKAITRAAHDCERNPADVTLIAVSKTFPAEAIIPVLESGHRVFGENYVQESKAKWPELRQRFPDVDLHMIGPLQSNKAGEAVSLFDAIHTLDRESLAAALAKEIIRQKRTPKLFVQVNTGAEPQKGGVMVADTAAFVQRCRDVHGLKIDGLMCIPPFDQTPSPHFALLKKLAKQLELRELSMGMSADYAAAIQLGATYVRVGSAIFGSR